MRRERNPGQRAGLTGDVVVAAATDLLGTRGLDGLTMRALADSLGVAPNALYSHVPSKTALIDALLDATLADVDAPPLGIEDPVAGLQQLMVSTYELLMDHPDLVPLYLARQGSRGPHAQHLGEVMIGLLARADVHNAAAQEAQRVLIVYTIGFAAFATHPPGRDSTDDKPLTSADLRGNFTDGLRWLLAGIVSGPAHARHREEPAMRRSNAEQGEGAVRAKTL